MQNLTREQTKRLRCAVADALRDSLPLWEACSLNGIRHGSALKGLGLPTDAGATITRAEMTAALHRYHHAAPAEAGTPN